MSIYIFWALFATGALIFAYWVTHTDQTQTKTREIIKK